MSNDPLQPQEEADIEGQNTPLDDVVAAGEEAADLVEESPVIEEIDGETPEALDDAAVSAVEEAAVPAVEEIHEAVAAEEHPHKKHSFFDKLFGHKEEEVQPKAVAVEQPALEEGAVEPAAAETPVETLADAPVVPVLGLEDVKAVVREEMGRAQSDIMAAIPPAVNLEDVRSAVQEEISRAQGDIQNAIQAEMARLENDTARIDYEAAQDTMAGFYRSKSEMTVAKVELLKQRQTIVFNDTSRPVKDVKEDVGIISEMLSEAQRDLAEVESVVATRAAATSELVASLGAREQIAALQSQLEEQKSQVAALGEKVKSGVGGSGKTGLNWRHLLGLAALLVVGLVASTLYLKSSMVNQKPAALMVETAGLYQSTGDTDEAIRVLDEAMATGIKDAQVLGRAGEMYRLLKQYDKAIDALNKALAKEPDNETYLLSLARTYGNQAKNAEAIAIYQKLTGFDSGNTTYLLELAARYRSNKNYDEAFAQLDKVVTIKPTSWSAYNLKGDIYREQQKWDEAIAQYNKALEISDNFTSHLNIGVSYAGKRDYAKALEQYALASGLLPERADPYYFSAEARVAQGKMDEAITLYQQAVGANDKYVLAYIGLGKVYTLKNDCASAVPYFQQALKYSTKNEEAILGLSNCAVNSK